MFKGLRKFEPQLKTYPYIVEKITNDAGCFWFLFDPPGPGRIGSGVTRGGRGGARAPGGVSEGAENSGEKRKKQFS